MVTDLSKSGGEEEFRPVAWLPGKHLETIFPSYWPASPVPGAHDAVVVPVDEGSAVRVLVSRSKGRARGTVLLVHGIGGSAESAGLRRTAAHALERGWAAVRMNLRNCGGTAALSRTLYNAGQSADVARVLEEMGALALPRPFGAVGFSLGGNLVLRYAGMSGRACVADAVLGINPTVDLEACCRALEEPRNLLYQLYFTRLLCLEVRRIRRTRPVDGPDASVRTVRTVRRFDAAFTAPDAGHSSAEDYYAACSAGSLLGSIRVPALVLSASNDPFVPVESFAPHRRSGAGGIVFVHPSHGGHLGYWQAGRPRFWAATRILDFLDAIRARD